jgi:catechol 2,3-dioxygenase-like lactoylglutathione lyase family enzyme
VTATYSHVGLCVSDLDRSLRFYRDGLGFELVGTHHVGDDFAPLLELENVRLESRFLRSGGSSIELLWFESPWHTGEAVRRPMNQLGLTHLSIRVDDVDAVAASVEKLGGTVVRSSRVSLGEGDDRLEFVYCTDPDGVRVELMRIPG